MHNTTHENHRVLHSFDLDETLFTHDHETLRILVKDEQGKVVASLSNTEFNAYSLKPGESFDFSNFRSSALFKITAKPVPEMIAKVKELVANGFKVEILTARADLDCQRTFADTLSAHGIDISKVHVRRAGNTQIPSTGQAKLEVLTNLLKENAYAEVHFYDDALSNLKAVEQLKARYPSLALTTYLVEVGQGAKVNLRSKVFA